MNNPVSISLKDFMLSGRFDVVEVSQSKEWILKNFPKPDDSIDCGHGASILSYGCLEFHFDLNRLFLIWCDHLPGLQSYGLIEYDLWILDN